jgi:hypothetical protein
MALAEHNFLGSLLAETSDSSLAIWNNEAHAHKKKDSFKLKRWLPFEHNLIISDFEFHGAYHKDIILTGQLLWH